MLFCLDSPMLCCVDMANYGDFRNDFLLVMISKQKFLFLPKMIKKKNNNFSNKIIFLF